MKGGYMRWVIILILLMLGLFRLVGPAAAPTTEDDAAVPTERPVVSTMAAPAQAATESPTAAVAAPAVLTPTVDLPVVFYDADGQYVHPYGHATYEGVSDDYGLSEMDEAGSGWVTTVVFWQAVQSTAPVSGTPPVYNWAPIDQIASAAQAKDMRVFALFTGNPPWAAEFAGGPVTNTVHLVNFVTAMAERYDGDGHQDALGSPVIEHWSFYAEPDNEEKWRAKTLGRGWWGNDPRGYADMLAQVAPAIHAANPNAKVFNGGLAYDGFTNGFNQDFLAGVLHALNEKTGGATHYLDGVAFHYYPIGTFPTIRAKAQEIQGILNAYAAGTLPLWVPEMGYWSDPGSGSSETKQAERLVQMYVRGLSAKIRMMAWFSVFDHAGGTETHGLFDGLGPSLSDPKEAYQAYATLTDQLPWYQYVGPFTATGVEGYTFKMAPGQNKTVLWATGAARNVAFVQTCVRRVGLLGAVSQISDGGAGDLDGIAGRVTLNIGASPTYIGACQ